MDLGGAGDERAAQAGEVGHAGGAGQRGLQGLAAAVGVEGRRGGQAQHALNLAHQARRLDQAPGQRRAEQPGPGQLVVDRLGRGVEDLRVVVRVLEQQVLGQELEIGQPAAEVLDAPDGLGRALALDARAHLGHVDQQLVRIARRTQDRADGGFDARRQAGLARHHAGAAERHVLPGPAVPLVVPAPAGERGRDGPRVAGGA